MDNAVHKRLVRTKIIYHRFLIGIKYSYDWHGQFYGTKERRDDILLGEIILLSIILKSLPLRTVGNSISMWLGTETIFSGSLGILECGNWSNMEVGGWVQNWICLGYVFLSFVTFSDIFFLCTFPPTQGRLGYICLGGRVDSQLSCTIYTKFRGPWRKCWLVSR